MAHSRVNQTVGTTRLNSEAGVCLLRWVPEVQPGVHHEQVAVLQQEAGAVVHPGQEAEVVEDGEVLPLRHGAPHPVGLGAPARLVAGVALQPRAGDLPHSRRTGGMLAS